MKITVTISGVQGCGKSTKLGEIMNALKAAGVVSANTDLRIDDPVRHRKGKAPRARVRFFLPDVNDGKVG